jgi:uroporphyrinogen decarboxylase
MHTDEVTWFALLDRLADIALASLSAQIIAGVAAVQLFDSWAGALSRREYEYFVLPSTRRIFDGIASFNCPSIHFGVGTGELLDLMAKAGPDVVGVDWRVALPDAAHRIGPGRALQGNLDPATCVAGYEVAARETLRILREGSTLHGHIFNLGHGVLPETDPEVLTRIVALVHDWDGSDEA